MAYEELNNLRKSMEWKKSKIKTLNTFKQP